MGKNIAIEKKYILEYIKENLNQMKLKRISVDNAKYHHNSSYKDAVSICKHGILTLSDMRNRGIRKISDEVFKKMDDIESHINGNDSVSLAVVGLTDLYKDEEEYDPVIPSKVDFLVNSDIKTSRSSVHYGNEFLSHGSIKIEDSRSLDIRLLELIESKKLDDAKSINSVIEKYNYLKDIAVTIKNSKIDILLRETSYQDSSMMDIDCLSTMPKLVLK